MNIEINSIKNLVIKRIKKELKYRNIQDSDYKDFSDKTKNLDDLRVDNVISICKKYNLNWLYIFSSDYILTRIAFRKLSKPQNEVVDKFKNYFDILKEFLNEPLFDNSFIQHASLPKKTDRKKLITTALILSKNIKKKYGSNIFNIYKKLKLPVVFVDFGDVDAMLLNSGKKSLVVINKNKASKIGFSLVHELCHFLLDRNTVIRPDVNVKAFNNTFKSEVDVREFIAVKTTYFFCKNNFFCDDTERFADFIENQQENIKALLSQSKTEFSEKIYDNLIKDLCL